MTHTNRKTPVFRPTLLMMAMLMMAMLMSACTILPESEPVQLLDPRLPAPAEASESREWTLNVLRPESDPARDSTRVLVRVEEGRLQVHSSARWVAPAPGLFRTLLVRYLRDRRVLAQAGAGAAGMDGTLALDLRRFELSETAAGQLEAWVQVEARLYDSGTSRLLAQRSFEARQPARSAQADDALASFEKVLGEIIPALGDWVTSIDGLP